MKTSFGTIIFGAAAGSTVELEDSFFPGVVVQRYDAVAQVWRTHTWSVEESIAEEYIKTRVAQLSAYRIIDLAGRQPEWAVTIAARFATLAKALA